MGAISKGAFLKSASGSGSEDDPFVQEVSGSFTADSEIPAAAALADNTANPTTPTLGSCIMVFDGTTWDRAPGTSAAGLKVQPATGGSGTVDATTVRACLATDVGLPAGSAIIGATYDAGPSQTISFGVSSAAVVSADMTSATALTAAPTSGQKLVIVDIIASSDTAMNILFEEETTGTDIFKIFVPANGTVQITPRGKIKLATADKKLTGKASLAGNVAFTVTYYSEA